MGLKVRLWKGITEDLEAEATAYSGPSVDPAAEPSSSSSTQSLGKVPGGQGINDWLIQLNMYPHICAHHGPKAIARWVADVLMATVNLTISVVTAANLSNEFKTHFDSVIQDAKAATRSVIREQHMLLSRHKVSNQNL